MPSRIGTSPDTVVSGTPPMSTCPERTSRITSGPCTFASGQLFRLNSMRPLLALGMLSRSIGTSTLVYCGIVGAACVTAVTMIFGPAGRDCAPAVDTVHSAAASAHTKPFNRMTISSESDGNNRSRAAIPCERVKLEACQLRIAGRRSAPARHAVGEARSDSDCPEGVAGGQGG